MTKIEFYTKCEEVLSELNNNRRYPYSDGVARYGAVWRAIVDEFDQRGIATITSDCGMLKSIETSMFCARGGFTELIISIKRDERREQLSVKSFKWSIIAGATALLSLLMQVVNLLID